MRRWRWGVPRPLLQLRNWVAANPGEPAKRKTRGTPSLLDAGGPERLAMVKADSGQPVSRRAPVQRHPIYCAGSADAPGGGGSAGEGGLLAYRVLAGEGLLHSTTCASTEEAEPSLPRRPLLGRLFRGVESTSCQAENTVSALSNMISSLRGSMLPNKAERMMFLRLNRLCIP